MNNLAFFQLALLAKGFLVRMLLFGWMELDLLTPVFHPPSCGMCPTAAQYTHPKNTFASKKKLGVEIAKLCMTTIYNRATILFSN